MFLLNLMFDWWTGFYNIQSLQELRVIIHPRGQVVPLFPRPCFHPGRRDSGIEEILKVPIWLYPQLSSHPITTVNTVECCFDLLSRLIFAGTTLRQTESLVPWRHQTPPTSKVFASATDRAALCLTFCQLSAESHRLTTLRKILRKPEGLRWELMILRTGPLPIVPSASSLYV